MLASISGVDVLSMPVILIAMLKYQVLATAFTPLVIWEREATIKLERKKTKSNTLLLLLVFFWCKPSKYRT